MHLLCLCSIYMKLSKTTGLLTTNRWILRGRMWVRKCPISRVLYQLRMVKNCLFRLPKFRDMPAIVVLKFHNLFLGGDSESPGAGRNGMGTSGEYFVTFGSLELDIAEVIAMVTVVIVGRKTCIWLLYVYDYIMFFFFLCWSFRGISDTYTYIYI